MEDMNNGVNLIKTSESYPLVIKTLFSKILSIPIALRQGLVKFSMRFFQSLQKVCFYFSTICKVQPRQSYECPNSYLFNFHLSLLILPKSKNILNFQLIKALKGILNFSLITIFGLYQWTKEILVTQKNCLHKV